MKIAIKILTIFSIFGIGSCSYTQPKKSQETAAGKIYTFTTQNEVKEFAQKNNKVVLQVFRPTCPVCIAFKKKGIYPKLAKNMTDIGFAMIDINNFPHVEATPTFIFYEDGQEIKRYAGYVEYPQFEQKIRNIFSSRVSSSTPKVHQDRPLTAR